MIICPARWDGAGSGVALTRLLYGDITIYSQKSKRYTLFIVLKELYFFDKTYLYKILVQYYTILKCRVKPQVSSNICVEIGTLMLVWSTGT
jgi:hypothetical protein